MFNPLTWHLLLNSERRILGVYGGALLDVAKEKRDELLALFPSLVVNIVVLAAKEVGNRLILDREAIKRGLRIMFEEHPVHFGNFISNKSDADTADVFVQCCLFGHVVYG